MQQLAQSIVFIGGGNMASAILGGLRQQGVAAQQITVVNPGQEARTRLQECYGVRTLAAADASLGGRADVVVWAVKPQQFKDAATVAAPHVAGALHISVAAGITTATLARWFSSQRIVRCMPNTPALIGQGMTGVYALPGVSADDRALADAVLASTGKRLWLEQETLIDSLMAISGSGPAYVFYWMEALIQGGMELGLTQEQARELAVQTFAGAAALAQASGEHPEVLRQQVTSKGGTTHAAITSMQDNKVHAHIIEAMHACYRRGLELGKEFV
ncbi:MAG: pyrroline-5-carboxylate reductase [Brachymonas sp.]